jgi:hypothetical protein
VRRAEQVVYISGGELCTPLGGGSYATSGGSHVCIYRLVEVMTTGGGQSIAHLVRRISRKRLACLALGAAAPPQGARAPGEVDG